MNTFSLKIDEKDSERIKAFLKSQNAVFDTVQYSIWRAKTSSFQAVLYTSGKLLIQGRNIDLIATEINSLLGVQTENQTDTSSQISEEKYIGTDESGKGDFFGPLIVAAVQVNNDNKQKFVDLGIKDSKKLDDKKILKLAEHIKANSVHSVIVINPVKYNELYFKFKNLNKLLAWGHARAIENILEKSPCNYALADKFGDESLIKNALMSKGRNIILNQMVRAEADIAVACASILARAEFVKRINMIENQYGLSFPKGASSLVIEQAKKFVNKYSFEHLNEVAKIHFKTVNEIK